MPARAVGVGLSARRDCWAEGKALRAAHALPRGPGLSAVLRLAGRCGWLPTSACGAGSGLPAASAAGRDGVAGDPYHQPAAPGRACPLRLRLAGMVWPATHITNLWGWVGPARHIAAGGDSGAG